MKQEGLLNNSDLSQVSTLYLKWYLIISELQNIPWPRPANANIGFVKETLPPPRQSSFATVAFI